MSQHQKNPRSLDEYLKINGIDEPMPTRCDLFFKSRLLSFFSLSKNGISCLKHLVSLGNHYQNVILKLKTIICLHHIVMIHEWTHQQILNQTIQGLEQFPSCVQNGDAMKWMCGLTSVYYNYIRKICVNSDIYELAKKDKPFSRLESINSLLTKIYRFINLIKNAFAAKEFILNFGRYFKTEFPVIIDVNKCIAEDLALLYNSLVQMINYLIKIYKTKLTKEQLKQLVTIVDQTFIIHQDIYILFYNRYYSYEIDAPKTNWLKLQPYEYQELKNSLKQKKKKKMDTSQASIDSLDLSQFQKTYFSQMENDHKEIQFSQIQV